MKKNSKEEFLDFLSCTEVSPSIEITKNIFEKVRNDLNPSPSFVFKKIGIIHLITGSLTLLFCPQFGISFLANHGIMHFYMPLGRVACSILCGATFLGFSAIVMSFILTAEESRVLRKNKFVNIFLLAAVSLLVFLIFGEPIVPGLIFTWLLGCLVMGVLSLEAGWFLKTKILA